MTLLSSHRITLAVLLIASGLIACHGPRTIVPAAPMPSSALLAEQSVDAVIYQHASAEAYRLFEQGYELARIRLDENLKRAHELPPAVIVDVDETVLDNSPYQVTCAAKGLAFDPVTWTAWCNKASAKALPGAVKFLDHAKAQGCTVFYITNRNEAEKAATVRNLLNEGFPFADDAHVMVMGTSSDKTDRRARVAADHYVALLVGDQLTDMDQRFKARATERDLATPIGIQDSLSRYFVLLPNPMYGTWLDVVTGRTDSTKTAHKRSFLQQRAY
jgi:5'-nucleotidase (lipoprotein e(P4) family)